MTARRLLSRELDAIEFRIAETIGVSLGEVRAMPNTEVEEWRGFFMARGQQEELERLKVGRHGR